MTLYDIDPAATGIPCECNGYAELVPCTPDECRELGCGRDQLGLECCARAFVCLVCSARIVGTADAPEMS